MGKSRLVKTTGKGIVTGSALLSIIALVCAIAAGASKQIQLKEQEHSTPLIRSVKGPDLFRAYCASCHGQDAKGAGPAASALKAKVPDLTGLARSNSGVFPMLRVRQMIRGEEGVTAAHGSREMPIWGPIFHQIEEDQDFGNVRLENLVKYLESIQSVPSTESGVHLYTQYCVACHGSDLKGTGPIPEPYRTPPDLTTLARRHGGKFPDNYVSEVLRNGAILPAHGPAEMPVWGNEFRATNQLNTAQVTARIRALGDYIRSLQAR
jgi:mono/diheme cytochrome c family protein